MKHVVARAPPFQATCCGNSAKYHTHMCMKYTASFAQQMYFFRREEGAGGSEQALCETRLFGVEEQICRETESNYFPCG